MATDSTHLATIEAVVADLEVGGFQPVLVGGMALVVLGSPRITRDFDFLISVEEASLERLVRLMYRHRLELVTRLDSNGDVMRTVAEARVATAKIKTQRPGSFFFYNPGSRLRVDLLRDSPVAARDARKRAALVTLKAQRLAVASIEDLIILKEKAFKDRRSSSDAQDLEFLKKKAAKTPP